MTQPPPAPDGSLPWGPRPDARARAQHPSAPSVAPSRGTAGPGGRPVSPPAPPQQRPGQPQQTSGTSPQTSGLPQQTPRSPQQVAPPAGVPPRPAQGAAAPGQGSHGQGSPGGPINPEDPGSGHAPRGGERILDTSRGRADGLDKCPRCGSTETGYSIQQVALVCRHCRNAWNEQLMEDKLQVTDLHDLHGTVRGSAAADIQAGNEMITLKCQGCGAEVVITTDRSLQARCHWCRQTLSLQTQIPNGAVPDAILPFRVPHEDAVNRIREFAGSRRFFALSAFRREFTPENVVGAYLPYMLIDGNCRADIRGQAETLRRSYRVKTGENSSTTYYDADVWNIGRSFRFTVDDLATEASTSREADTRVNTNNVIDTIQPFDTKAAVGFNPSYLTDFTSERRDLDIGDMQARAQSDLLSIARAQADRTISRYDRGVRWDEEALAVDGSRWLSVYLPVWLYSYYERKGDGHAFVHYIAVNGRTGETMGSVPVSHPRIFSVSCVAGLAAFLITLPMVGLLFV